MHVLLGKKQIVLAALVVSLGLAVFVNWYYSNTNTKIPDSALSGDENQTEVLKTPDGAAEYVANPETEEYFASVRLTRNCAHDTALEELQTVLASASEDGEAAKSTAKAIEELSGVIKMEADIESLVSGKTGSECVAVISDNTVEIILKPEDLNDGTVLTISDIVGQVCEGKYENIKISGAVS